MNDGAARCVYVVSGLPRSGTSLAMDLLQAGGMELFTDGAREPDADNPNGYFEHILATRLRTESDWVYGAIGKAVKIISPSLRFLPVDVRYRIVFMRRDVREISRSQERMLERLGKGTGDNREEIEQVMASHLHQVEGWIALQEHVDVLYLDYAQVVTAPEEACQRLIEFAGLAGDAGHMAARVDPMLYRQRETT